MVLVARSDGLLVAMATGSDNKLALNHDYPIREWEAAGPVKPSIARLGRIILIPDGYLGSAGLIGHLSGSDIAAMKTMPAEMIRNR